MDIRPTKPLQRHSGDLTADRRADYAEMLFGSGENAAAAEVMLGALELAPDWTLGWFRLGEMREAAGAKPEAVLAWRMALTLDPADRTGASLKLQLAGAAPLSAAPPSAFVEALFDQYAGTFDDALVDALAYRGPQLLAEALGRQGLRRFGLALDLGCGTGLMGERLRPNCDRLEGFDLSSAMLEKAQAKLIYDRLVQADLQTIELTGQKADLVTAADVFNYVGALDGVVARVAAHLAPHGLFAFTLEKAADDEAFALQPTRRFTHSERYVRRVLADNNLTVLSIETHTFREDHRKPVEALIVVAAGIG